MPTKRLTTAGVVADVEIPPEWKHQAEYPHHEFLDGAGRHVTVDCRMVETGIVAVGVSVIAHGIQGAVTVQANSAAEAERIANLVPVDVGGQFPLRYGLVVYQTPARALVDEEGPCTWDAHASTPGLIEVVGNFALGTEHHRGACMGAWIRPGVALAPASGPDPDRQRAPLTPARVVHVAARLAMGLAADPDRPIYGRDTDFYEEISRPSQRGEHGI